MAKTLYEILGVAKDATAAQIKKAYRKLAKKYHPDTNVGDKKAELMFKEVTAAYETLSDETKRETYDLNMNSGGSSQGAGAPGTKPGAKRGQQAAGGGSRRPAPNPFAQGNPFGGGPGAHTQSFESFFGYDPHSNDPTLKGVKKPGTKNPADTSSIFDSFFRTGKK
ncbi:hypothetical protein FACS189418_7700 [Clostridia bacterium]|nr:hypothetical protein FACS189418_7700 [Clostridia bacterium]